MKDADLDHSIVQSVRQFVAQAAGRPAEPASWRQGVIGRRQHALRGLTLLRNRETQIPGRRYPHKSDVAAIWILGTWDRLALR